MLRTALRQAIAGPWLRDPLWTRARAVPSLDLDFAGTGSLRDRVSGLELVTFTRAGDATFVDSTGTVRKALTNLLVRSEEFDNASWTTTGLTVTANSVVSPAGTTTADTLLIDAAAAGVWPAQAVSITEGVAYTVSIYLNTAQTNNVTRVRVETSSSSVSAWFTLSTRTWSNLGAGFSNGSFQNVSSEWVRASITYTPAAGNGGSRRFAFAGVTAVNGSTPDTGKTQILWGAQLVEGTDPGPYLPTGASVNGAPRFTHDPSTGRPLGLLVEESRTNLLLRSEEFDSASWTKIRSSITANATTAPNGTPTADKLVEDTSLDTHIVQQASSGGATTSAVTYSVYAKASERSSILLSFSSSASWVGGGGCAVAFDLSAGTAATVTSTPTAFSITPISNGWYKCSITGTPTGSITPTCNLFVRLGTTSTYQGDGTSGIFLWGAQLEAGAFPTSYIPTTGTSANRAADVATITGTNFSRWYRQDEGTFFVDYALPAAGISILQVDDGTANNLLPMFTGAAVLQRASANAIVGGVNNGRLDSGGSFVANLATRCVYALRVGDRALTANGSNPSVSATPATMPAVTQLLIQGASTFASLKGGTVSRIMYWPRRLDNSVLTALTR